MAKRHLVDGADLGRGHRVNVSMGLGVPLELVPRVGWFHRDTNMKSRTKEKKRKEEKTKERKQQPKKNACVKV